MSDRKPPPGYLSVTERGVTRYIPRNDPPQRRPPALVGDVLPPIHQDARPPVQTVQTVCVLVLDRLPCVMICKVWVCDEGA